MYNNICFNYAKKGNENKKKLIILNFFFIFHFTIVRLNTSSQGTLTLKALTSPFSGVVLTPE